MTLSGRPIIPSANLPETWKSQMFSSASRTPLLHVKKQATLVNSAKKDIPGKCGEGLHRAQDELLGHHEIGDREGLGKGVGKVLKVQILLPIYFY